MTVLVWAWVVVNTVGLAAGLWNSRDAYMDIFHLGSEKSARKTIAWAVYRAQTLRAAQSLFLWLIGLSALFEFPPTPARRFVAIVGLMAVAALITVNSALDARVKRQLLRR